MAEPSDSYATAFSTRAIGHRRAGIRSASQAKADALARVEELAKEAAKVQQQVNSEVKDVKQSTATNAKITDIPTNVGRVETIADLKTMRGDLGVQSGLIATNAQGLAALKRLGERNYFEFKLGKTKAPQRVGDITLMLKKTDPKKNKYSVDVMADDKLTEKKDKSINEPLQFYTARARQPYELVVNSVAKD